ncbi:hypothetical protein L7F22_065925 [Adiantum nelumboides]|nr:hypothetical protein [Adiantum nelumboides]
MKEFFNPKEILPLLDDVSDRMPLASPYEGGRTRFEVGLSSFDDYQDVIRSWGMVMRRPEEEVVMFLRITLHISNKSCLLHLTVNGEAIPNTQMEKQSQVNGDSFTDQLNA